LMYASPKYNGEPTAQALATGLATLGRYGDDYMVHASEGETIVPGEIFEANPRLKQDLFRQMTMMGIEDPNRYVVGNSLNSLNPVTGQPEFFFKKIWRAAKKVLKVAAPVIAPILGNLIMPGLGGIIASALTTKLMGGSWGDALKSGAMSWAGQGLMGGIGGLGEGGSGFFSGMGEGLSAPLAAGSNLFSSGAANPLAQGILGPRGAGLAFSGLKDTNFANQPIGMLPQYQSETQIGAGGFDPATGQRIQGLGYGEPGVPEGMYPDTPVQHQAVANRAEAIAKWGDKAEVVVGEDGLIRLTNPSTFKQTAGNLPVTKPEWYETLKSKEFLGPAAAAAIPAGLAYGFSPDEPGVEDEVKKLGSTDPRRIAYEAWLKLDSSTPEARRLRGIWYGARGYETAEALAPVTGITLEQARMQPQFRYGPALAARGGEVVGRGTGTSDSIPARLSDGEFVMTADAVRNAGNGDRNLGAARMYDMMSRFERTG
jgi:hypothetical protein